MDSEVEILTYFIDYAIFFHSTLLTLEEQPLLTLFILLSHFAILCTVSR